MSDIKDKILKKVGKKGKTKVELATILEASYSTVSVAVNDLVAAGKLAETGTTKGGGVGRPATLFGAVA